MFKNSNKKTNNTSLGKKEEGVSEEELKKRIDEDFITHNMPAWERFSGQTYSSKNGVEAKAVMSSGGAKKTGLSLMIAGGVLLLAALVAVYWFLIKPILDKPAVVTPPVIEDVQEDIIDLEPTPTTSETVFGNLNDDLATNSDDILASTTDSFATSTATSSEVIAEEKPVISSPLPESLDSDNDGLTDAEERVVGTDPENADTDNDGYSDYQELLSGYDPLAPQEKLGVGSTLRFNNLDGQARVLYPADWELMESPSSYTVVFSDSDQAFIQANYQDNDGALSAGAWLANEIPGAVAKEFISGEGWTGFILEDGLTAYVFSQDDKRVYNFTCLPLAINTDSPSVFTLMLKTLIVY
jgi:hypothetical protein